MDWYLPGKDVCAIGGVKESLHLKDMGTECRALIGTADRTAASVELAIRKTCGIQVAECSTSISTAAPNLFLPWRSD